MEAIKKLLGAYLIGVAMVVAVWFIINTFFIDSFNVSDVWYVLDVLMLVGWLLPWYTPTTEREGTPTAHPGRASAASTSKPMSPFT